MTAPPEQAADSRPADDGELGEEQLLAIAEFVRQVGSLEKAQAALEALTTVQRAA